MDKVSRQGSAFITEDEEELLIQTLKEKIYNIAEEYGLIVSEKHEKEEAEDGAEGYEYTAFSFTDSEDDTVYIDITDEITFYVWGYYHRHYDYSDNEDTENFLNDMRDYICGRKFVEEMHIDGNWGSSSFNCGTPDKEAQQRKIESMTPAIKDGKPHKIRYSCKYFNRPAEIYEYDYPDE